MGKNTKILLIDSKLYSLESIYGAAYAFLDKAYIFLESGPKSKIKINFKGKGRLSEKKLNNLQGEFLNELLNFSLREQISKRNKKIREYIVARALISALPSRNTLSPTSKEKIWEKDPLGIAVPWEEKYSAKKQRRKKKRK